MDLSKVSIANCKTCGTRFDVREPGQILCPNCIVAIMVINQWFTILQYRWKINLPLSKLEERAAA